MEFPERTMLVSDQLPDNEIGAMSPVGVTGGNMNVPPLYVGEGRAE